MRMIKCGRCNQHGMTCEPCTCEDEQFSAEASSLAVDCVVIPQDVLDLVRFLAETWAEVDAFVYENCTGEQLSKYPVVQGTRNQLDLKKIGQQKYDSKKIRTAVNFLLAG